MPSKSARRKSLRCTGDCRVANVTEALIEQLQARFVLGRRGATGCTGTTKPGSEVIASRRAHNRGAALECAPAPDSSRPKIIAEMGYATVNRGDSAASSFGATELGSERVSPHREGPNLNKRSAGFVATQVSGLSGSSSRLRCFGRRRWHCRRRDRRCLILCACIGLHPVQIDRKYSKPIPSAARGEVRTCGQYRLSYFACHFLRGLATVFILFIL
jgi:hypothetical protein